MTKIKKITGKCLSFFLAITLLIGNNNLTASASETTVKTNGFENGTGIELNKIGSYVSGFSNKDGGVAEIISYDAVNNNAWVVNGATGKLDILSLSDVTCAVSQNMSASTIDIQALVGTSVPEFTYGDMTSVSINSALGIAAVALQDASYDKNGYVALLTTEGELITLIEAGCQPDMVTFTPDGTKILAANEGEPREGIGSKVADPKGSVTIITVNTENISESTAVTVDFGKYDSCREELTANGIMLTKDSAPSTDLEPEYIAATNTTAYVALQEANAIAVLNLNTKEFTGIYSMGYKDLSLEENAIDLLDDGTYAPATYTDAVGAYMPDGISVYIENGNTYLLTANEGDAREWGSDDTEYCNETKETLTATDGTTAKKVRVVDTAVTDGMPEGKNVLFGGRSFSVYLADANGLTQIYDSGNDFESKTAAYFPEYFNCSNDDNEYDSRSAKKGPEPESVTTGTINGKTYAFIALERIGGIMVYDITNPYSIAYSNYINTRDFSEDPDNADSEKNPDFYLTGDIAPEGLCFISAESSPSNTPILLGAFEVSGTVAAFAAGSTPAEHTFSDEWSMDADNHWHELTCGYHTETANFGSHDYGTDNICDICNYNKEETPSEEVPGTDEETKNDNESESGDAADNESKDASNSDNESSTAADDETKDTANNDSKSESTAADKESNNITSESDKTAGNNNSSVSGSNTPKTGGSASVLPWYVLLFVSTGAFVTAIILKKRKVN